MYLKALEIQGFKSFPDRIQLRFGDDITAIVGPNGSGKSNLSDAIRWVMGEQSTRALRGNRMEDVIFGGTQKRPQLGFAEASLIFDNSDRFFPVDSDEMMVTRRCYRSGENEYYLNKQSVRLKDINELFMDTGLGREGYSNISQGRIDEILSLKSTDRRDIFEEAAGISKYRHRKEDSERRLERTEENLLRIEDKISELSLQVEPLREQSEQAKQYLSLQEELKGQEVAVWLLTLSKLNASAQKAESDYSAAKFVLDQEHENLDALYRKSESLNQAVRDWDVRLERRRESLEQAEALRQQLLSQKSVLETEQNNVHQNIAGLNDELDAQHQRTGGVRKQLQERENRLREIDAEALQTQAELNDRQAEMDELSRSAEGINRDYLELRNQLGAAAAELTLKQADLSAIESASVQNRNRMETLTEDRASAALRSAETEEKLSACTDALHGALDAAQSCRNMISGYLLRQKTRDEKVDLLRNQMQGLTTELKTASAKLSLLREMEREFEGYSKAVRFVMQQSRAGVLSHIHGPVSRLFQTEDRLTVALEIALGGAMQDIVVDTEPDAKLAIQLLKSKDVGRATFLPLSAMKARVLKEAGLSACRGFVGIASDLIQCKDLYRPALENLLGRTVICESLDAAIEMSRRYRSEFKIVTLDGQVMNPGGSMTGGSVNRTSGVLTRSNEIRRLERFCRTQKEQTDALSEELTEATRQRDQVVFELETARSELREQEDRVLRLEGEEKQYRVLLDAIQQAAQSNQAELSDLEARMKADENRRGSLLSDCETLEARQKTLQAKLDALSGDSSEISRQGSEMAEKLTALKMKLAGYDAEKASVNDSIRQLQTLSADLEGDRDQKLGRIREMEAQAAEVAGQIAKIAEQAAAQSAATDGIRLAIKNDLASRADTESERTATDHAAQQKNKDILDLEREATRLESRKTAAELEQKQILDKLWDSYELTPATAPKFAAQIESAAAANRRISELHKKLRALGTPNLGAIDEYARVSERYTYLTGQRDDVLHSKRELEAIIRDLTKSMTEIFTESFAKINHYFGETFVEMFRGGKASLELEDPQDSLNCGIEIKVQPPGKQLKTILLLSGGEKAFVAIALYFSILKVRPTPFCMLDEIDAALDDRNVERFAGYLRQLCRKTQFIVITHRRGTMEEADALFGVTMQEQGVSKILQLDLNSMEKELGITN